MREGEGRVRFDFCFLANGGRGRNGRGRMRRNKNRKYKIRNYKKTTKQNKKKYRISKCNWEITLYSVQECFDQCVCMLLYPPPAAHPQPRE